MKEYALNDSEQIRTDAINLVDHLTEYMDSGDKESANELFEELIHSFIVNGFLEKFDISECFDITAYGNDNIVLGNDAFYRMKPITFVYYLLKYCFSGYIPQGYVGHGLDLDFPEWKVVSGRLFDYFYPKP